MTSLSAGWRRRAASRLRGAMTTARRGHWTPTLRLRGLTRRGRFTSPEAGLVVTLVTDSTPSRLHSPAQQLVAADKMENPKPGCEDACPRRTEAEDKPRVEERPAFALVCCILCIFFRPTVTRSRCPRWRVPWPGVDSSCPSATRQRD